MQALLRPPEIRSVGGARQRSDRHQRKGERRHADSQRSKQQHTKHTHLTVYDAARELSTSISLSAAGERDKRSMVHAAFPTGERTVEVSPAEMLHVSSTDCPTHEVNLGCHPHVIRGGCDMLDRNSEDDRYGSIAFLDGSVSPGLGRQAVERQLRQSDSARRIALTDRAARVMTDFTWDVPVTVAADRFIDDALRDMIAAEVRALLVMRGEVIVGLITSYDIQSERPLQFLNASGFTRHSEIEVGQIMTPWDDVPTIDLPWVTSASVADVLERFRRRRDSHFVVVEYAEQGGAFVRGMFSRTHIERQLGEDGQLEA